jgi:hypothetical protein
MLMYFCAILNDILGFKILIYAFTHSRNLSERNSGEFCRK